MLTQRGKTGDDDGKTKDNKQDPKEIFTTSPSMIVEKKITVQETENDIHRQNSKRMQKHP